MLKLCEKRREGEEVEILKGSILFMATFSIIFDAGADDDMVGLYIVFSRPATRGTRLALRCSEGQGHAVRSLK